MNVLGHVSAQFVLKCTQNDLTLIEMYGSVTFWLGHLSDQTGICMSG